jgi:hypothetical protein
VAVECARATEVGDKWEEIAIDQLEQCIIPKVNRHRDIKWHHEVSLVLEVFLLLIVQGSHIERLISPLT